MEDFNKNTPLFKKIDRSIFEQIDKFKVSPGYNNLQDFYNGLDEEQQKIFKASSIFTLFFLPLFLLGAVWWNNQSLKNELDTRVALVEKANEIIGQRQSLTDVLPRILSDSPIDGDSMMSSRISNLLSSIGGDLSKIQVSNYNGEMVSGTIMRAEADFRFTNLSTDELMNIFTAMIQREKFKIDSVTIKRNAESNLLNGEFHAIHFGNARSVEEE
jgi:hypothetical protein